MKKVIVGSVNASRVPEFPGNTWTHLQYVAGLQALGVESFWVDRLYDVDVLGHRRSLEYLMRRFHATATDFGFANAYCVVYNDGERYFGLSERQLNSVIEAADLLINISGHSPPSSPLQRIPRRAYIDVDPGFTQMWACDHDMGLDQHNLFFTVGQNVRGPDFHIPTHNVQWIPIHPPVVMDLWPPMTNGPCEAFSTIADWRGSQEVVFNDQHYSGKRPEFMRVLNLPCESQQKFELALCIGYGDYDDIALLCEKDWELLDPYLYAGDPHCYREFIQTSRGEFSVAKNGYVKSNSGWISDRTVCYLSSGKPALVQSTGFESSIPTGHGLLTFRTLEEAVDGIRAINRDYLSHCQAARQLAEKYFDSNVVLGKVLEHAGL